jgi:uncharacterized protein YkwD
MSPSVTKLALAIGVPLVTLATVGILGSHPTSLKTRTTGSLVRHPEVALHPTPPGLRHWLDVMPTPTPTPPPQAVPASAPNPAPVAQRPVPPAPVHRPPPPPPPPVSSIGGAAGTEFSLVNQDRRANGAGQLAWSGALARVAQYRAQDMLNRNYFSHYDPSTGQLAFVQLMHLWGIPYSTAGENIAWSTNPSMANINVMFMNSPEHRANILNGAYHRVGIGVASNGGKVMVVEVFSN